MWGNSTWLNFLFLKEENRNLCESEPDKAECIREVEEAKGTEQVDGDHRQGMN